MNNEIKRIKLSTYAKQNDCCYLTAYNRFKKGTIKGVQLDTGSILIDVMFNDDDNNQKNSSTPKSLVIYARVSSNDRKEELQSQVDRLTNYAINNGYIISKTIKEIGSAMNDNRNKLNKILENDDVKYILVENKDRLTRFGFNYIKTLLNNSNRDIIVVNSSENNKEDLMKDFISLVTSFCGRIYGNRSSNNKSKKILEVIDGN